MKCPHCLNDFQAKDETADAQIGKIVAFDCRETITPWMHDLWAHLHNEHGLTLLESELHEIVRRVRQADAEQSLKSSKVPETDEEVIASFQNCPGYSSETKRSLIGIYQCRRGLGDSCLEAYISTMRCLVESHELPHSNP